MAAALIPPSYAPLPPKKKKRRIVRAHQFAAIATPASANAIKPAVELITRSAPNRSTNFPPKNIDGNDPTNPIVMAAPRAPSERPMYRCNSASSTCQIPYMNPNNPNAVKGRAVIRQHLTQCYDGSKSKSPLLGPIPGAPARWREPLRAQLD